MSDSTNQKKKPTNQDIHPLDVQEDQALLAFDKFIQIVVKGSPNSQTVASLTDLRELIESSFASEFRPDMD